MKEFIIRLDHLQLLINILGEAVFPNLKLKDYSPIFDLIRKLPEHAKEVIEKQEEKIEEKK